MHPYLILVLAGYAAFVGVLGAYWLRQYASDLRAPAKASEVREQRDPHQLRKAA